MQKLFDDIDWHSCFELDKGILDKKYVARIKTSNAVYFKSFIRAHNDSNYLIHKSTKALWRFSEDGKFIEPVFEEDILTEEDLK